MTIPSSKPPAGPYVKVKSLLFEALEREPQERAAFLDGACRGEEGLREEVVSLLRQMDQLDGFLDERVDLESLAPVRRPLPSLISDRFSGYRVIELIGYGGMGMVYLAEQDRPRRRVALKVLRSDSPDELARKRFELEGEVLGRLRHPGIAQIYEAGVEETDSGSLPFLAMEYVEGEAIHDYVARRSLSTTQIFSLVAEVADALHHAHEQGVLHRDLKPGNVLVTREGRPKLLDFGVAAVRDERELGFHTRTGQLLGTIAYMSPEQARGADVDERSDEYSLAVILYELLAGRLPFDTERASIPDLVRSVVDTDALPLADSDSHFRGDVQTIVHKALSPDAGQRYRSVAVFADDLRRFVHGRPISARPPSLTYRGRRCLGRHRQLAASFGAVGLALVAAATFGHRATRRAVAAEERETTSRAGVLWLSHARMLDELEEESDELWPVHPHNLAAMDRWLERADLLVDALDNHRAHLAQMVELPRELDGYDAWAATGLNTFVERVEDLSRKAPAGLIQQIRERRRASAELHGLTVRDHAEAWRASIDAIADRTEHPEYRGLRIDPQVGLVPLGQDPHSGLFEFCLYNENTSLPKRDPGTGKLVLEDDFGVVLVLLPGGKCLLGAQRTDPDAPNYEPLAAGHEQPVKELELDPFFIGKYELTQAQLMRIAQLENPSYWEAGSVHNCEFRFSERHPAEHANRHAFVEALNRMGCELPTESQWEYAARGGIPERHWGMPDDAFVGCVNGQGSDTEEDRFFAHAPVGSFPPNPFGLHDTLGNVWELCRDDYKVDYLRMPLRSGDGLVLADGGGDFSRRGGSFMSRRSHLRVSYRGDARAEMVSAAMGVRPARRLAGEWTLPEGPVGDG